MLSVTVRCLVPGGKLQGLVTLGGRVVIGIYDRYLVSEDRWISLDEKVAEWTALDYAERLAVRLDTGETLLVSGDLEIMSRKFPLLLPCPVLTAGEVLENAGFVLKPDGTLDYNLGAVKLFTKDCIPRHIALLQCGDACKIVWQDIHSGEIRGHIITAGHTEPLDSHAGGFTKWPRQWSDLRIVDNQRLLLKAERSFSGSVPSEMESQSPWMFTDRQIGVRIVSQSPCSMLRQVFYYGGYLLLESRNRLMRSFKMALDGTTTDILLTSADIEFDDAAIVAVGTLGPRLAVATPSGVAVYNGRSIISRLVVDDDIVGACFCDTWAAIATQQGQLIVVDVELRTTKKRWLPDIPSKISATNGWIAVIIPTLGAIVYDPATLCQVSRLKAPSCLATDCACFKDGTRLMTYTNGSLELRKRGLLTRYVLLGQAPAHVIAVADNRAYILCDQSLWTVGDDGSAARFAIEVSTACLAGMGFIVVSPGGDKLQYIIPNHWDPHSLPQMHPYAMATRGSKEVVTCDIPSPLYLGSTEIKIEPQSKGFTVLRDGRVVGRGKTHSHIRKVCGSVRNGPNLQVLALLEEGEVDEITLGV